MKSSNLAKSIVLVGPACVGKTLVSTELAKRTGYKIISIDDIKSVTKLYLSNRLSRDEDSQEDYIESTLDEIHAELGISEMKLEDENYARTERALVQEIVDSFNYYYDMFDSPYIFAGAVNRYYDNIWQERTAEGQNRILNNMAHRILNIVLDKLDEPIIVDCPAPFVPQVEPAKVVFLRPAGDYNARNAEAGNAQNEILLDNLSYYSEFADIEILTSGIFNDPSEKILKKRVWCDVEEYQKKQELLNRGIVASLCDEIIERVDELNESGQL